MEDAQDDMELVADYRDNGNTRAFEALFARHSKQLIAFLKYLTGNMSEAEEVFQEAWMKVVKKIDAFKGGSFRAWITTVARNCYLDRVRKSKPQISLNAEDEEGRQLVDSLPDTSCTDPFANMGREATAERIRAAVSALPEAQREVFLMRTEQEMSFAEIAETLSIPLNTALGRMHYAVSKLRKELADL